MKVDSNKTPLIISVVLMAIIHSIVNIGLPVLMVPILKSFNKIVSYGYLSAGISATEILISWLNFINVAYPINLDVS